MSNNKIYPLLFAAGAIAGCTSADERVSEIKEELKGTKVLTLYLSSSGVGAGVEARFYDHDGDGKTVEEFVRTYVRGGAINTPIRSFENMQHLLSPGAKNTFGGMGGSPVMKTMTAAQQKQLDSQYQMFLRVARGR